MMPAQDKGNDKTLQFLLSGIADIDARHDCVVTGLSLNSKTVAAGNIFFALAGHKEHGLNYAAEAIKRNVCAVVWESDPQQSDVVVLDNLSRDIPMLPVTNLKQKLGIIAERFYDEPSKQLYMIGITGTNGKTSCSHFLAQALNYDERSCVIGTLGNGFVDQLQDATHTTPDAITLHALLADFRDNDAKNVVMEVSSHGLSQGRVAGISYDMAIFTNLSRDHLDYHGDMASYGDAKKLLFDMPTLQTAIINNDDEFGRELADALQNKLNVVRYGIEQNDAAVRASKIRTDIAGLHFDVISRWGSGIVSSSLLGRFNVSNLLAVLGALLSKGVRFEEALLRVSKLSNVPGRMQRIAGHNGDPLCVVDYAHTPDALGKALQSLRDHLAESSGKLWCVFGCGGDRDPGKRAQMGEMAEQFADQVIVTDDNPRTEAASHIVSQILEGVIKQQNIIVNHNRVEAIRHALDNASAGDVVLVAGKGHEEYQVVGTERLPYEGDAEVVRKLLTAKHSESGD